MMPRKGLMSAFKPIVAQTRLNLPDSKVILCTNSFTYMQNTSDSSDLQRKSSHCLFLKM